MYANLNVKRKRNLTKAFLIRRFGLTEKKKIVFDSVSMVQDMLGSSRVLDRGRENVECYHPVLSSR